MKILMVLTSHARLGNTGKTTGIWLEEFASPYYVFRDAGADVTLASPLGGQPPVDPASEATGAQTAATQRLRNDPEARAAFANTVKLSGVSADDYDAVFYPGGHGPLWDLAENAYSISLINNFWKQGKPVAAVCHAPAIFRHVKTTQGRMLVKDRKVTGFSNAEEEAVGLGNVVPFMLEDMLKSIGAQYSKAPDWQSHVVEDGQLITGQNPASSEAAARALLRRLRG